LFALIERGGGKLKASEWQEAGDGFLSKGTGERMAVPYQPPAEYDMDASFTRKGGLDAVFFVCPMGETGFLLYLGDVNNKRSGLVLVRGQYLRAESGNPTARDLTLSNDHVYSTLIQVRSKGVRVLLDEKAIVDFPTNGKNLSVPSGIPPRAVGFGSIRSQAVFHSIWLKEVSGVGKSVSSQEAPG
jgi:hypothetical protein